ncbi:metallophosphoesterase [Amylibacter sp. IMCC11727]|uniref:metallophosphoesterase n=1 Tax=Amylibacter sp. IMCC11727 TaxID=3039851 RepID=UPI00244D9E9B|nr:metallophosphoesterase [Amylibacter sp. IMCC11727]WGI22702.1 metallophosphoesterase [Amylibacter sp. IMCC11727]
MLKIVSALLTLLLLTQTAAAKSYVWAQLVGTNLVSLRVISTQSCSAITGSVTFQPRIKNTMEQMNGNTICEALIDLSTFTGNTVTVDGHTITLPKAAPKRVVILGDTGCRKDHHYQHCSDTSKWNFNAVAAAIAKTKPDLMVHVGDYVYRYNCWNGTEGCAKKDAHGNVINGQLKEWYYWEEDFFKPAADLLPLAPWVFTRGNHEDCENADRGWRGWAVFLAMTPDLSSKTDPVTSLYKNCKANKRDIKKPELIQLPAAAQTGAAPALNLYAFDTANEDAPLWSGFSNLTALADETWIVTHVPFASFHGNSFSPAPSGTPNYRSGLPDPVSFVVSGHVHLFQYEQPKAGAAIQLVVGGSGTKLDNKGLETESINAQNSTFVVLDRAANGASIMTVCAVPPGGTASAWQTWDIAQSNAPWATKMTLRKTALNAACTSP